MTRKTLKLAEIQEPVFDSWHDKLKPAETLGKPEQAVKIAQDSAHYNHLGMLGHSLDLGQMPTSAGFMGYGALQDISQNGLIRACIETVADDMTREFGTAKAEDAELVKKLNAEFKRLNVQKVLHEVAEMVGYFGGCLVYIDTGADDATLQLKLNISNKSDELGIKKVRALRVIDPINVYAGQYNSSDPLRADFYKPEYWYVMGKKVHSSRLLRFVANEVPQLYKPLYNFFGIPQAQILWDYVMHFNTCRVATAEMLTKFSMTVMKTQMSETLTQMGGEQELMKRLQLLARTRNNNSVIAIDMQDEDIIKVETPLGGLTDIGKQALEFLAALNRTPAVKLLGISPSGFNATGESDIRNYYDHIKGQREKVFGPAMETLLKIVQLNVTGEIDKEITFEWDELGQEDEAAIASLQKTKADTLAVLLDRNIISQEEGRQFVAGDPDSGFSFIDPDELPEDPEDEMGEMEGGNPFAALMGGGEEEPKNDDVDKAGEVDG